MVMLKGKSYTGADLGTNFGHKRQTVSGADGVTRDQWENLWVDGVAEIAVAATHASQVAEDAEQVATNTLLAQAAADAAEHQQSLSTASASASTLAATAAANAAASAIATVGTIYTIGRASGSVTIGADGAVTVTAAANKNIALVTAGTGVVTLNGSAVLTTAAGKATDAALLNGSVESTTAQAWTIGRRDGTGNYNATGFTAIQAAPYYKWTETGVSADNGIWKATVDAGVLTFLLENDAGNATVNWLTVTRAGMSVSSIDFKVNPTVNGTAVVTGTADAGATANTIGKRDGSGGYAAAFFLASGTANVGNTWMRTDAGTDNKRWDVVAGTTTFTFRVLNDANSAASNWLAVTRSGLTVASVSIGGASGSEAFSVIPVASQVNHLSATGSATGSGPTLLATGSDSNISLAVGSRGTGDLLLQRNGATQAAISGPASAVNYVYLSGAVTGQPIQVQAVGADSNIGIKLTPKGTEYVWFGAWTSNADAAVTGYVTIKDAAGNLRKLATIA